MFTDEGVNLLRIAVIKQAINDWAKFEMYGGSPSEKKEANRAWKFLSNAYSNLWIFTDLEPEAVQRVARQVLEQRKAEAKLRWYR